MIWPFGIIDARCIEQFGTKELPLKEIFQNKRIVNENIGPYS